MNDCNPEGKPSLFASKKIIPEKPFDYIIADVLNNLIYPFSICKFASNRSSKNSWSDGILVIPFIPIGVCEFLATYMPRLRNRNLGLKIAGFLWLTATTSTEKWIYILPTNLVILQILFSLSITIRANPNWICKTNMSLEKKLKNFAVVVPVFIVT